MEPLCGIRCATAGPMNPAKPGIAQPLDRLAKRNGLAAHRPASARWRTVVRCYEASRTSVTYDPVLWFFIESVVFTGQDKELLTEHA